jgi:acetyltransferase EpsM
MATVVGSRILYGAGGHGKVALEIARLAEWLPDLVLDDDPAVVELMGVAVHVPRELDWSRHPSFEFHVSVGDNATRRRLFADLCARGGTPRTLVHPTAAVSSHASLGRGCLVAAQAVVNPGARVGDNVVVNTSASVDHDCEIGSHAHLAPGVRLGGLVRVGTETLVGIGACAKPGIVIGCRCVIGAGAVIVRDVPDDTVVCGNPARRLRSNLPSRA